MCTCIYMCQSCCDTFEKKAYTSLWVCANHSLDHKERHDDSLGNVFVHKLMNTHKDYSLLLLSLLELPIWNLRCCRGNFEGQEAKSIIVLSTRQTSPWICTLYQLWWALLVLYPSLPTFCLIHLLMDYQNIIFKIILWDSSRGSVDSSKSSSSKDSLWLWIRVLWWRA